MLAVLFLLLSIAVCVIMSTLAYLLGRVVWIIISTKPRQALQLIRDKSLLRPDAGDIALILLLAFLIWVGATTIPGFLEGGIRAESGRVRQELSQLRDALTRGESPGVPPDPFARTKAIYTIHQQGPRLLVVSVGPDHVPQIAAENPLPVDLTDLTYDPTNGTRSAGDIWLEAEAPSR